MILDRNLIVSGSVGGTAISPLITGQAVTATAVSIDSIDLSQNRDLFNGNDMVKLRISLPAAFATLTSLAFEIVQADDAALTSNVTVVGSSGPVPLAQLTLGRRFVIEGNARIGSNGQRFLGARYTVGGSNATAGSVFAEFGDQVQDNKAYPVGYAVL
ncbi:MAG: Bbp16 family capsid cement protein [Erythrobacter sp.]